MRRDAKKSEDRGILSSFTAVGIVQNGKITTGQERPQKPLRTRPYPCSKLEVLPPISEV